MSNQKVKKHQTPKNRYLAPVAGVGALVATASANAALDLSALTTEMQSVETAVAGVIAVAITIGIAIVGWRWAKRGLFSV